MKYGPTFLVALVLSGCYDVTPRIAAPEGPIPAPTSTSLWTMVLDQNGACIPGATLTIVRGPGAGTGGTQESPCDRWEAGGGYTFMNLAPFVPITLRASAPGYGDQELTVTPNLGPQLATVFSLSEL